MDLAIELFGYLGTVLVIVSMLMTSVTKLRIINMCGGSVSLIYSLIVGAMPIAVMNAVLIVINLVQVIREFRARGAKKGENVN